MTIKSLFRVIILVAAGFLVALSYFVLRIQDTQKLIVQSEVRRFQSYRAAQELEQSSDQLTMMARLYTVTGDPKYERYFFDILAIRSGEQPRPPNYSPTYWDFVLNGSQPYPPSGVLGRKESFEARLGPLGFSEHEMSLLRQALQRSDALTALERKAFAAMKGLYPDAKGNYTVHGKPDPAYARGLVHGADYLQAKGGIMAPIARFTDEVEKRTGRELATLQQAQLHNVRAALAVTVLFSVCAVMLYVVALGRVMRPIGGLTEQAGKLIGGNYSARNAVEVTNELGALGAALNHMSESIEADLAERKRTEEALRRSEERYALAMEGTKDGIWEWDILADKLYLSPRWKAMLGYGEDELSDRFDEFTSRLHPEDRERTLALLRSYLAGETPVYEAEYRLLHKEGHYICSEVRGIAVRDEAGKPVRMAGSNRDVTERKRIEERLRTASAYARSLIEASLDPLVTISVEGKITDVNEATIRATGVPREQLVGSDFSEYFTDPDKARAGYREVFSKGFVTDYPLAIRHTSGKVTEVLYNASVYRNEKGEVSGVFAAARDVTERQRDEEKLFKLNEQLSETVAELRQREREMGLVNKLNDMLQTCRNREEAYPLIAMTAAELFPRINGGLATLGPPERELQTVAQWGSDRKMQPVFTLDDCWALRAGQAHLVDGSGAGAQCAHYVSPPKGGSLCLPLMVQGEMFGVLHLNAAAGVGIERNQHQLAVTLGEVVKLALSNIRLREALREQAMRDPLTGLLNRRYLDETLPREVNRAMRQKIHLSVAMMDIDHFKNFNDTWGHEAGDEVLRLIGKTLRSGLRSSDIACRFGGEEFILIMLETGVEAALQHLQQICGQIKKAQLHFEGQTLPGLTVSVGVAQTPDHGTTTEELLRAADQALYAAKQAGRDRIEIFSRGKGR